MITEALGNFTENGASLRVRYFGRSTAGGEREVQHISVKDGKVRAHCLFSGEEKPSSSKELNLRSTANRLNWLPSCHRRMSPANQFMNSLPIRQQRSKRWAGFFSVRGKEFPCISDLRTAGEYKHQIYSFSAKPMPMILSSMESKS